MPFRCEGCKLDFAGSDSRRFCSNACQRGREQELLTERWLETGTAFVATRPNHYIRLHLLQEQLGRCAICDMEPAWAGKQLVFVLDHVDGDAANSARANLRLICPNCDSQLPTYKARNRGKGRATRRARYAEGKSY